MRGAASNDRPYRDRPERHQGAKMVVVETHLKGAVHGAHQVAIALLDYIAEMNADAKLDPTFRAQTGIAFNHTVLHFNCASHGVDDAAELDKRPVAGSLDDPASMNGDPGIDEIAAKSAEARQRPILVGARKRPHASGHGRGKAKR